MQKKRTVPPTRQDIVPTSNTSLSEALSKAFTPSLSRTAHHASSGTEKQMQTRADFVEPPSSDPMGYERIIGESDLTSINYLDRGRRAAAAVCRIRVPAEGGEWYGTAFLVGPRLLMTNHHVLGTRGEASQAEAEFTYEHDLDGVLQEPIQFNLCPHEVFYTDAELDVTFVAVSPLSDGGTPIERFGWLPLLPLSGKSVDQEWVTIIQHPGGGPKQISIRSNRIVMLQRPPADVNLHHFIHYLTDTEPGSSGAPVLNDQWQVVALHHKAVPAPNPKPGEPIVWIGNEGVRVSAIYHMLETRRLEDADAGRVLDRLDEAFGFTPMSQASRSNGESAFEKDGAPFAAKRWKKNAGYDAKFLSERIDLAPIYAKVKKDTAPLLDGSGEELKYNRFSVVLHAERKFALLTAVNVHGELLRNLGERKGSWRQDARVDGVYQPDGEFYEKNKGSDKIQFSRGHLVRRLDPCWGDTDGEAKSGEEDTFHYPNAAPQFQTYNDVDWGNLEDYVLNRAQTTEKMVTIFTGPIFRKDDPWYGRDRKGGPWRIPLSFWKIAVLQKSTTRLAAAAFIVGQTNYVQALYEAKVFSGLKPYRLDDMRSRNIQTTIETIEKETKLDFSAIRPFDAHGSLESTRRTRWINRAEDVMI